MRSSSPVSSKAGGRKADVGLMCRGSSAVVSSNLRVFGSAAGIPLRKRNCGGLWVVGGAYNASLVRAARACRNYQSGHEVFVGPAEGQYPVGRHLSSTPQI